MKHLDSDTDIAKKTEVVRNDFTDIDVNHPAKQKRVCNENVLLSEPG